MKPILLLYWRICRLTAGPEDVPFSGELLAVTLLLWMLLQALLAPLQAGLSWLQAISAQLLGLAILVVVTLTLLQFKNVGGRAVQSLAALAGIDLILGLFGLPLLLLSGWTPVVQEQAWYQVLFFLLLCWQLLAQGHVFHRALNVGPVLGTAVAMMVLVLTVAAIAVLIPDVLQGTS